MLAKIFILFVCDTCVVLLFFGFLFFLTTAFVVCTLKHRKSNLNGFHLFPNVYFSCLFTGRLGICFEGEIKYYAGCRSAEKTNAEYEREISAFCREIDAAKGMMTIKFNTLYNSDCAYRVKLKCDRLNKTREVRLLCPGEQYLDTIREVFKARGFTILDYELMTQN